MSPFLAHITALATVWQILLFYQETSVVLCHMITDQCHVIANPSHQQRSRSFLGEATQCGTFSADLLPILGVWCVCMVCILRRNYSPNWPTLPCITNISTCLSSQHVSEHFYCWFITQHAYMWQTIYRFFSYLSIFLLFTNYLFPIYLFIYLPPIYLFTSYLPPIYQQLASYLALFVNLKSLHGTQM